MFQPNVAIIRFECKFETAISQLELPIQNYYRLAVAMNPDKLIKNHNHNNKVKNRQEWNIIERIKHKSNDNSLTISKDDKGKNTCNFTT
jgi:hypothetical protein